MSEAKDAAVGVGIIMLTALILLGSSSNTVSQEDLKETENNIQHSIEKETIKYNIEEVRLDASCYNRERNVVAYNNNVDIRLTEHSEKIGPSTFVVNNIDTEGDLLFGCNSGNTSAKIFGASISIESVDYTKTVFHRGAKINNKTGTCHIFDDVSGDAEEWDIDSATDIEIDDGSETLHRIKSAITENCFET